METVIAVVVVVAIVGLAVRYIYKAKKSGAKCIGCPESGSCASVCSCGCGCAPSVEQTEKEFLDYGCGCGCCGCDEEETE